MGQSNKETTAATVVTQESITGLTNIAIANEFYKLIEDKPLQDIMEIGEYIKIIAVNRKVWSSDSKQETTAATVVDEEMITVEGVPISPEEFRDILDNAPEVDLRVSEAIPAPIKNEFAMTPDDETRTMILFPMEEGQTSIKLNEKTAKILIAMLNHQIQEWR